MSQRRPGLERRTARVLHEALVSPVGAALAVLLAIAWTVPMAGLVLNSFSVGSEATSSGWWTLLGNRALTLDNYRDALAGSSALPQGLIRYLVNSLAIALPATALPLFLGCMAAYALAWMPVKGSGAVLMIIIGLQLIPLQMALLPLLEICSQGWTVGELIIIPQLDVSDSYVPLWIAHTAFALPLAIFLLYGSISALPRDVIEAARIDGASHAVILARIVLPLALPAIAAFTCLQFILTWNDLLVALAFTRGTTQVAPITAFLVQAQGRLGADPGLLAAAAVLAVALPVVLVMLVHRVYARGLLGSVINR